jgi:hypothetical protein
MKCLLVVLFISLSASALAQVPDGDDPIDTTGKAPSAKQIRKQLQKQKADSVKNLTPMEGKAIVYIVRPSIVGMAVMMRLDCDSFQVGWIGIKSFLYTILDSGQHIFKAMSENESDLTVHLESGKVYFIDQEPRMGFAYARTKLLLLNEETGRKYLSKCGLSHSNRYPNFPLSRDMEREPPSN